MVTRVEGSSTGRTVPTLAEDPRKKPSAGRSPRQDRGSVGMYTGVGFSHYPLVNAITLIDMAFTER